MLWFLVITIIFIVTLILLKRSRSDNEEWQPEKAWPFYAKKPMSNIEQVLYFRLKSALPEYIVLSQVQLSRIIGVKRGHNFWEWNNRINRLSADFVICRKDASVVAVIELDDKTHERAERIITDEKKSAVLNAAGVPLIRWNARTIPNEEEIKNTFPMAASAGSIPNIVTRYN